MMQTIFSKVMWVGKATVFTVGLGVIMALLFGVASAAFADNGDFLRVGRANTATVITRLAGSGVDGPMMQLINNSDAPGATALDLRVEPGKPPMKVGSGEKVANLNADQVDGLDSSELQGQQGPSGPRGPQGEPGEPGSALAYAHINADGTFDPDRSKNVRATFRQSPGRYCIDFTVQEPLNVVATIDALSSPGEIRQRTEPGQNFQCPGVPGGPYKVLVLTTNSAGTAFQDKVFDIAVN